MILIYQRLLNLGSNFGNRCVQYNLALVYQYGKRIEINMDQAIYCYKKSADQGYELAQSKLHFFRIMNYCYLKIQEKVMVQCFSLNLLQFLLMQKKNSYF